jgi:hypothetical protein
MDSGPSVIAIATITSKQAVLSPDEVMRNSDRIRNLYSETTSIAGPLFKQQNLRRDLP